MANNTVTITLGKSDCYQLLSGLDVLIEQWQATAEFLRSGHAEPDICIRESHSEHEAESIADMYIAIRNEIRNQAADSDKNNLEVEQI